jgi:putative transposase
MNAKLAPALTFPPCVNLASAWLVVLPMSRPHYVQPAGVALHIIQRARATCFPGTRGRLAYLHWLRGDAERFECAVHAYVLMGNHVHLLLTPARADGAAGLMHALRVRYERYVAEAHERGNPLWEEGFDASPIHARQYLLACMRYIESNPVRAHLVPRPGAYRWSSYRANAHGQHDALVTPHPLYYALGRTPEARQAEYRTPFGRAPCMLRARP